MTNKEKYEECCSLWAGQYIAKPGQTDIAYIIKAIDDGIFWNLFQAIKADGKKKFFVYSEKDPRQEEFEDQQRQYSDLPQHQEEINVEDIPF